MKYSKFIEEKTQLGDSFGFDPLWMPDFLFDFQKLLVEWAIRKGRAAIFADCGLGKTPMQLTWAHNVVRKTNGRVLILTPLAVGAQTMREAEKFGIEARREMNGAGITVANYEKLHHFDWQKFQGVVCDESSILKNFDGKTRKAVTDFMRKIPYRLLCTATAAPNDYIELGTSSEALGVLDRKHMLSRFFTHDGGDTAKWRLKGHARSQMFWRWVCSWARAIRKPSDLGFEDGKFILPPLRKTLHVVDTPVGDDCLFAMPAIGLDEQRKERKRTIAQRCSKAAESVESHRGSSVSWCHLNDEGDLLERLIKDSVQISGSDSDEKKEETFMAFSDGQIRVIVTKPTIGGFGMNWQHCSHQTFFPSHSFEQWYQAIRRSWRFGQEKEVGIDVVTSEGEQRVLANLEKKEAAANQMFDELVAHMDYKREESAVKEKQQREKFPEWIQHNG